MSARSLGIRELDGPFSVTQLASDPSGQVFRSLALGRCIGVLARIGVFAELSRNPSSIDELARRFAMHRRTLQLILAVVAGEGLVTQENGKYSTAAGARAQLDPESPTSVVTLLSHLLDHNPLWDDLEFIAAGGQPTSGVPANDDEPGWLRRVRGQYEYARRAGRVSLESVRLPAHARSIVDVGGSHGWFSAALCQRNPMLTATVLDCAPAVAVGREIMWEAGLDHSVRHEAGDIHTADLGGPHDVAICVPLMYGLRDAEAIALLGRIRAALRPGGLLLVPRTGASSSPTAAAVALYLQLDSGVTATTTDDLVEQLRAAGFSAPAAVPVPTSGEFELFVATAT